MIYWWLIKEFSSNNSIVIASLDGELLIKKILKNKSGYLKSVNPQIIKKTLKIFLKFFILKNY